MSNKDKLDFAASYRDLEVHKNSFRFQQAIFDLSKTFPSEERYSLTHQIPLTSDFA
jgi:hypothetical protein